jgi:hypothetical protein
VVSGIVGFEAIRRLIDPPPVAGGPVLVVALVGVVVINDDCINDGHAPKLLDELQACLGGHFDVEHSTFQLEPASHGTHEQLTQP